MNAPIKFDNPVEYIRAFHPELTAVRRDIHRHPETGFEERRTATSSAS